MAKPNIVSISQLSCVLIFIYCVHQVIGGSRYYGYYADLSQLQSDEESRKLPPVLPAYSCPVLCTCHGKSVNCAKNGLTEIPKNMPVMVERLNLQNNKITKITKEDFKNLRNLRIIQLMDNKLTEIEEGALDDLVSLERLRLNRNNLKQIPANLFAHLTKLYRLDVSHNEIIFLGKDTFAGAVNIKNLQLDHNQIGCITESALKGLERLEQLTLNVNNLTTLPPNIFDRMSKLRVLRISENNFLCDCRLTWLSKWLSKRPQLGLFTKCALPPILAGAQIAELRETDFQCSVDHRELYPSSDCTMVEKPGCPAECHCQEDILRCNQKGLSKIPAGIPESVQELHLEGNGISSVPSRVFSKFKELRRLFLNDNRITHLALDAFAGLENLYSLVLSRNEILELPRGVFSDLKGLQLLLLDGNKLTCIPENMFDNMKNLVILSLYKNELKSLANGTLKSLQNVQQLTLAGNPWVCDCNLRWLNDFMQKRPRLTLSGDTLCENPLRMRAKKIGATKDKKFRCKDNEEYATKNAGLCDIYSECPAKCRCSKDEVDCSGLKLTELPDNLPPKTKRLILFNNNIKTIKAKSIMQKLVQLKYLDLSNNNIDLIESGSFKNLQELEVLNLSQNKLADLDKRMLDGLRSLQVLLVRSNRLSCLNNDTFLDSRQLTLLSLYDNRIRCIMGGTFGLLTKLISLNLDLNPLNCNCHMNWLPQFAVTNFAILRDAQPHCASPELLSNTPVVSLTSKDFKCVKDKSAVDGCHGIPPCCSRDTVSCDPRAFCPANCTCEGTVVRCTGANLLDIPKDIPLDTTQLFLSRNRIDNINTTNLVRLRHLELLDLSHNRLYGLKEYAFQNMSNLKSLSISFNRLACIHAKSFAGLTSLRVLILQGNDISSIPFGSFDDLTSLNNIGLNQNPIYCDCNVKWLIDVFHKRFLDNGLALCKGPPQLVDRPIFHARPDDFQCDGDKTLPHHSKCNICTENPCANNGKCKSVAYDRFECSCPPGFVGKKCERKIDACFGQPCANDATCQVVDRFGRFKCVCKQGFTGIVCEENIDDCLGHKCLNKASCVDGLAGYTCKCQPGFSGKFCETQINYCVDFNPCQNNGRCEKTVEGGYRCHCVTGWEGKDCEKNRNDCEFPSLCLNGGTCVDLVGGYRCNCRPGYAGTRCAEPVMPALVMDLPKIGSRGVCTYHECLNGGRCVQEDSEYRCLCLAGYEGKKCEKLTSVGFYSDSYATVANGYIYPSGNITLLIATTQKNGVILYLGSASAYFILSLFDGYIRVSYNIGVSPGTNGYSYKPIDDGKFHTVSAVFEKEVLQLFVDSVAKKVIAPFDPNYISFPDWKEQMYIGALPKNKMEEAKLNVNIRETFSFGGCLQKMLVNNVLTDFKRNHPNNYKLIEGCPSFNKPTNPCLTSNIECKHKGKCVARPDLPEGYECRCSQTYSGKHCELKSCKRLVSREFYTDPQTGCKSRRQLKVRKCQGTCPATTGYCCAPKKTKRRMIKFTCPDGRRITKAVEIVRRCGCKPCGNHNSYWFRKRYLKTVA